MNLILMLENQLDAAAVTASSAASSMPATNLQDPQRTNVWRSSGTTGTEYVDITRPSGTLPAVEVVAVVDHNLALTTGGGASTVRVQSWSDAINGASPGIDQTITVWTGFTAPKPDGLARPIAVCVLPSSSTDRYWRVTLVNQTATYVQAGRIYLGPKWQPTVNMSWDWPVSITPQTQKLKSRGGQSYGVPIDGQIEVSLDLDALTDAERSDLLLKYQVLGDHTPFPVCLLPEGVGTTSMNHTLFSYYVTFGPFELRETHLDRNRGSVKLVENL